MDADNFFDRFLKNGKGGTVEPAHPAPAGKEPGPRPPNATAERYELRDPVAEVTYRPKTWPEVTGKADELGISRFTAVAEDGRRTPVQKVDGQWQRGPQRPAAPRPPLDPTPVRDERPQAQNVVPLPGATKAAAPAEQAPAKAAQPIAAPDAQIERDARVARLKAELLERYVVKRAPVSVGDVKLGHTEYRFRGNTSRVAFTESTFRLATNINDPFVARSMVDVAESRQWKALRVSGHEEFRQRVWFEASLRGVKTVGYEPLPSDLAWLNSEREKQAVNRIEPARDARTAVTASPTEKTSARGGGGRKAVLAAIEAVLVARNVPEAKREAVMAAASDKLAQRIRDGQAPKVKVWDKAAPSQRPVHVPTPEIQRTRDRAAPAPAR